LSSHETLTQPIHCRGRRKTIREATGCREDELGAAIERLEDRIAEEMERLRNPVPQERTFAEAAAKYVVALERRGKTTEGTVMILGRVMETIGYLPLSHICNAMARSVIDEQRRNGSDYVFPGPKGVRVERLNNTGFRNARKAVNLPVRWHDLRHTFGERAAAAGVPWDYRKVLLGHEIKDITGHYSAPGLARLLDEAEKITREGAVILRAVRIA